MLGHVTAVAFEDHTTVETARCYVNRCTRLLIYSGTESGFGLDTLGWRVVETPGRWSASREWFCGEHYVEGVRNGSSEAGTGPGMSAPAVGQ